MDTDDKMDIVQNDNMDTTLDDEYGHCCFCGTECNIASQSCGKCVRNNNYLFNNLQSMPNWK